MHSFGFKSYGYTSVTCGVSLASESMAALNVLIRQGRTQFIFWLKISSILARAYSPVTDSAIPWIRKLVRRLYCSVSSTLTSSLSILSSVHTSICLLHQLFDADGLFLVSCLEFLISTHGGILQILSLQQFPHRLVTLGL